MFRKLDFGVDIGNSKFTLCVKGEGIISSESAYIAFAGNQVEERSVVAIGDEAKRMYLRSPDGISVYTPMIKGVINDSNVASILLNVMKKRAGLRFSIAKPSIIVGSLFGATDIEKKAFKDVAESIGCSRSYLIAEPLAAAMGGEVDFDERFANMIVDVGDGATEVIVTSQKKVIAGSSIRFGGDDLDNMIREYFIRSHGLSVPLSQARKIKIAFGLSQSDIAVTGVQTKTRLPKKISVEPTQLLEIFQKFASNICAFIKDSLTRLSPEAYVDIIENGIFLCGGASRSFLLRESVETSTKIEVHQIGNPQFAVISGINNMLTYNVNP